MPILLPLALLLTLSGDDTPEWPGFRGANGSGVSSAKGLPTGLDPETNLMWRVDVPSGYSSPCVAGKDLYLTGTDGKSKLYVMCFDAGSGEERWRKEIAYDGSRPGANSPAAPSPATDGERVYALFHHAGLVVYDKTGKELWKKPIGPFNIPHGMAASPVLHGDLVLLQIDQDKEAYLVAFDKRTGDEKWRTDRPEVAHGYATPAVYAPASGPAQIVLSGSFQAASYSLADGKKLWWVDGAGWQAKSIPVFAGNRCYVNSFVPTLSEMQYPSFKGTFQEALAHDANGDGKLAATEWDEEGLRQLWFLFDMDGDMLLDEDDWKFALQADQARGGLFAIDLGGKGDVTKSNVAWKLDDKRTLSDVTSPVIVGNTLFVIGEGGLLASIDGASGKVIKHERVGDSDEYFASPVAGDGKLYFASLGGLLSVVSAEPDWKVLSQHALDDSKVWATPALVGHSVYVRSEDALYCFEDAE